MADRDAWKCIFSIHLKAFLLPVSESMSCVLQCWIWDMYRRTVSTILLWAHSPHGPLLRLTYACFLWLLWSWRAAQMFYIRTAPVCFKVCTTPAWECVCVCVCVYTCAVVSKVSGGDSGSPELLPNRSCVTLNTPTTILTDRSIYWTHNPHQDFNTWGVCLVHVWTLLYSDRPFFAGLYCIVLYCNLWDHLVLYSLL